MASIFECFARFGEKMMKKLSINVLILLMLTTLVSAAVPVTKYAAVSDTIWEDENTATYKFTITNVGKNDDRFQLYTISSFWDIDPTIVAIPALSIYTFDLEVTLNDKQLVGPQLVPVTIKSLDSGDFISENLYVYVKPSESVALTYVPNVALKINTKDQIDPREPLSVEVNMKNRNQLDIKELRIVIESEFFNKEVQTTLGPLEEKTNQVLVGLNNLQEPGVYTITLKLVTGNKTIAEAQKEVKVIEYSQVSTEQTRVKGLFSYSEYIKLHNDGNTEAVKQVKVQKNFFQKIFTTSSEKYTKIKENGVSYMSWSVPLKPQESYEISVKTSYNILVIIFILIVAGIICYYLFRSPIILYKRAKIVTSTDEGITEIRVKLHLKNRSGREVRTIKVIDRHPKIVSLVEEENTVGALRPTKMLSADKVHSLLMWNLEALEPYEERLLTYTIKSKLNIVGNIHLHSAKARFHTKAGERTTNSNDVLLLHRSVNSISYK